MAMNLPVHIHGTHRPPPHIHKVIKHTYIYVNYGKVQSMSTKSEFDYMKVTFSDEMVVLFWHAS